MRLNSIYSDASGSGTKNNEKLASAGNSKSHKELIERFPHHSLWRTRNQKYLFQRTVIVDGRPRGDSVHHPIASRCLLVFLNWIVSHCTYPQIAGFTYGALFANTGPKDDGIATAFSITLYLSFLTALLMVATITFVMLSAFLYLYQNESLLVFTVVVVYGTVLYDMWALKYYLAMDSMVSRPASQLPADCTATATVSLFFLCLLLLALL